MRHLLATSLVIALCVACDSASQPSAGSGGGDVQETADASTQDARTPLPRELTDSERAWAALVAEHGATYWYRASECSFSTPYFTWVQVTNGEVTRIAYEAGPDFGCSPDDPFLSDGPVGQTFEGLYAACAEKIASRGLDDVNFAVDEEGVVQMCWAGPIGRCFDACDEGFRLAERGFGVGPFDDAGGID